MTIQDYRVRFTGEFDISGEKTPDKARDTAIVELVEALQGYPVSATLRMTVHSLADEGQAQADADGEFRGYIKEYYEIHEPTDIGVKLVQKPLPDGSFVWNVELTPHASDELVTIGCKDETAARTLFYFLTGKNITNLTVG